MKTPRLGALTCAFFVAQSISVFAQGSLTPPSAPAPTMKTLDQVEPRTPLAGGTTPIVISQPGSYYLTGNLRITAGGTSNGINVFVSNVTIDLNGFEVAGSGATSGVGVIIAGGESNVTVRNGTIRNWGSHGINGAGNPKLRTENLRVLNNGGNGILGDVNAEVLNCAAESNVGYGIKCLDNCIVKDSQAIATTGSDSGIGISVGTGGVVTGCAARSNSTGGILTDFACTLANCTASYNTGVVAISGGPGSTLTSCTASYNFGSLAISAGSGSALTSCTAHSNTGITAIDVDPGSTLTNCSAYSNTGAYGIYAHPGCTLIHCSALGNTSSNFGSAGISTGAKCTLIGCSVTSTANTNGSPSNSNGVGIQTSTGSTIKDCTVSDNKGDGIQTVDRCSITGCTVVNNGNGGIGDGVHTTGVNNRIDGNLAFLNSGAGIHGHPTADYIVRNTANGNSPNYNPASGTYVGPFSTPGSATSPWANF